MTNRIYKWLIKNNPYNTNYSDLIVQSIINSAYLKDKVADLFIMFIANLIRIHVDGFFAYLVGSNNYIMHILISTILYYLLSMFYFVVSKFRQEIYECVKYIIGNYNDKIKLWRRYLTFGICAYILILTCIINIDNNFIRTCIIEYAIVFLIVEIIEEKYFSSVITRIRNRSSTSQSIWQTNDFDLKVTPSRSRTGGSLLLEDETDDILKEIEEVKREIAVEGQLGGQLSPITPSLEEHAKESSENKEELELPKPIVKKSRKPFLFVSDDFKI